MDRIDGSAPIGPAAPSPSRPHRLSRVAGSTVFLMIAAFTLGYVPRWRQRAAVRQETLSLATPTVAVVTPAPGKTGPGLLLPADIAPLVEASIHARASGYLKRWLVDIGAEVKAGHLLAEIEAPEVAQDLDRARADLAQAEASLSLARTTASRWSELVRTASVSEQETAEKQADLALKAATVEGARANVRRLQELLSFTRVTAPFAGTVTARRVDVGVLVSAGSGTELFHLEQTRTLRVFVRVPQAAVRGVVVGQTAELLVPELPGRAFAARVVRTAGAMTAESRTLLVELEVDNPRQEIVAGSFCQVRLTEAGLEPALTLPSNTLLFRAEGPQVGVVRADGQVELRAVEVGRDFGPTLEILAGVSPGDRVILNPPDSLVAGARVNLVKAAGGERAP